jgi:hypothetical protein
MTGAVIAGIIAVVVVLVIVTRNSARVKREAKEDLKREMEALPARDIMDLVKEEAAETGVDEITGGEGVDLPVRLQVWHRDEAVREACPDLSMLRFEVDVGVAAANAEADQVRLTFDGYIAPEPEPESESEPEPEPEPESESVSAPDDEN